MPGRPPVYSRYYKSLDDQPYSVQDVANTFFEDHCAHLIEIEPNQEIDAHKVLVRMKDAIGRWSKNKLGPPTHRTYDRYGHTARDAWLGKIWRDSVAKFDCIPLDKELPEIKVLSARQKNEALPEKRLGSPKPVKMPKQESKAPTLRLGLTCVAGVLLGLLFIFFLEREPASWLNELRIQSYIGVVDAEGEGDTTRFIANVTPPPSL